MARKGLEAGYIPPIYRIIGFLNEIRLDIREQRFIKSEQKKRAAEWRARP